MPGLLDLPVEIRLKIFSYYPILRAPYWRVAGDHPAVSLVNRQLRHESLSHFYSIYRWSFRISISEDGSMACMDKSILKYMRRLQRAGQLWRIQKARIMYTFTGVRSFSSMSDHFDARYPEWPCFYDPFCDILCQAPLLRNIEFSWIVNYDKESHLPLSPAGLRPLALLPKTCDYQVNQMFSSGPVREFANCIEEATGKSVVITHSCLRASASTARSWWHRLQKRD